MLYTNSIASFVFYKFYKSFVPLLNKFSQKLYFSRNPDKGNNSLPEDMDKMCNAYPYPYNDSDV